ncbi:GNAT family N-acetyltransferase [Stenotrophomonas maltophilia]|uniref:GNAT family N-acetyltransferase n=1 Tax=Stenotrophomonas maltophilia TaxID=40324 RepID=A0AA89W8F6_STEMA|nr:MULTISPECIES: GNAT family N-acetyltransferase [Stenotrophomonas]MBH1652541.1 GNAT family N-acetyltransferase [Stenotrophomonas maltophilia]HDS1512130.1 GNAT family N-acetyltransferase [Stenotrophomonas maltophilia]
MSVQYSWPTLIDMAAGAGIVALYNDAIKHTDVIGYQAALDEAQGAALIAGIQGELQRGETALMLIRDGEQCVGMVLLSWSDMPNCRHIATLSKGIIRSDYQGRGLVRDAFLSISDYCDANNFTLIMLDVRENSRPHKLWQSLGFTEYGRVNDYARIDGVSHPGVYMQQTTAALRGRLTTTTPSQPMLSHEEFKLKLRYELESRITLTHPIVKKILDGTPQWDLLRRVTLQGYQLTKHFLEYIETLYHHCPRGVHKKRLLFNMFEEETGRFSRTSNHVVLMENFVRAIGIQDAERDAAIALPNTRALIDYRMDLVRNRHTFHMGAAAVMIASEGQNLETAAGEARHELLPRIYGLTEADLRFFSVHQKEDVGHVAEGISLVADICTTPTMQQEALEVVRKTCDLFYGMYDGMYEAYAT